MKYAVMSVSSPENTTLLKVCDLRRAQLWGQIYLAQGRKVIAPVLSGQGLARLEQLPLSYLYWNLTNEKPPEVYADLVQATLLALEQVPVCESELSALEAELTALGREVPTDTSPKAIKAPKEPKAPRTPAGPSDRPKEGSSTGKVWDACDQTLGDTPVAGLDWKAFRVKAWALAEAEGLNPGTFGVQFGKWKATKLSA